MTGNIQLERETRALIDDRFNCEVWGKLEVRGKGRGGPRSLGSECGDRACSVPQRAADAVKGQWQNFSEMAFA